MDFKEKERKLNERFEIGKIQKIYDNRKRKKNETSMRFDFYYVYFVFNLFNQIRAHSISTALSHSFHGGQV